jgi:hypothetical protein
VRDCPRRHGSRQRGGQFRIGCSCELRRELHHRHKLQLQSCHRVERLDAVGGAYSLEFLNFSECGDVQSLSPLQALRELRVLYLYGTTRVLDSDLTPLTRLPHLAELRMQSRREYRPSVREIQSHLAGAEEA